MGLLLSAMPGRGQGNAASNPGDVLPDQAHVMADIGYHFANLWFAAAQQNWPLARYYVDETRSHLQWAVRIQPIRKTESGTEVDLNGILAAITNGYFPGMEKAIESKDLAGFQTAYRATMVGCYACHSAVGKPFLRLQVPETPAAPIINFSANEEALADNSQLDDAGRGRVFFQQNCALCHATVLGPGNVAIGGQGPSLVGIIGRRAASAPNFNYTKPLTDSGLVWDAASLDHFLSGPMTAVPGTTMLVTVPSTANRHNLIAYLSTLNGPVGVASAQQAPPAVSPEADAGAWVHDAPDVKHRIDLAALPAPYATSSAGNGPRVVRQPADAKLSVPPHFTVKLFAAGLAGPRLVRVAPNGDIFIAETRDNRIRIMRAADGADAPSENQVFADGLDRPFGIAFYPPGDKPQWIYVGNNNSVVRIPYQSGDLKARDQAEIVVPRLTETTGGHTTRDVAFSKDGKRMFISVGSGSNIAEGMKKKDAAAISAWEAEHGFGTTWGSESNRADVLVCDPEGHLPLHVFAAGIRNGVGLAVNPDTGELWVSTNERDALGDDLVPDYVSRVKEGGYYGWPWYYMGNHEDPRHAGERPDLAGKAIVPDVPLEAHSASLEMTFYTAHSGVSAFPKEYRGDAFAAEHGSWNRSNRTGSKIVRIRLDHGVPTGEYDDFLTGFVVDTHTVWGRPVGVAVAHDGALLVTEDGNGTMWRVSYSAK
jgi:hypothetical protein